MDDNAIVGGCSRLSVGVITVYDDMLKVCYSLGYVNNVLLNS